MVSTRRIECIGKDRHIDLARLCIGPSAAVGSIDPVDLRALDITEVDRSLPRQSLKRSANIAAQVAIIGCAGELRLPAVAADGHGSCTVRHCKTIGHGEHQSQVGMAENLPVDHPLFGVVII